MAFLIPAMPYHVAKQGCSEDKPFAVVGPDGEVHGCYASEASARRQIAAININEHTKTAIKRESGLDFPPRDYAYVPDPMRPATWRLRLTETPGVVSVAQLQRAAASLSPAGFRGNRLEIPPAAATSVKRRLLAEFRRLKVADHAIPASVKSVDEGEDFLVWKDAKTNRVRWFAVYSNNFLDDDHPREIISAKSHERFVEMVDQGLVDYPELWLWHLDGTAWGKADWVEYADGFALASGYVYPGFEDVAENVSRMKGLGVSHGMVKPMMVYDPADKRVIIFHVTHEISPLPGWAAANKLTGFSVYGKGENTMPIAEAKKDFLEDTGLKSAVIAQVEEKLKATSKAALEAGLESKEVGDEGEPTEEETETEDEDEVEEAEAQKEAAKPKKKPAKKKMEDEPWVKESALAAYVTRDEAAEAFAAVVTPLVETINGLSDQLAAATKMIESATKEIAALQRSDEERLAATKEVTPTASLADIILSQNPIGKAAARVKEKTHLKEEGPVETEAPPAFSGVTNVPFVNDLMAQSQSPRKVA